MPETPQQTLTRELANNNARKREAMIKAAGIKDQDKRAEREREINAGHKAREDRIYASFHKDKSRKWI
jgi:hypothetical protein